MATSAPPFMRRLILPLIEKFLERFRATRRRPFGFARRRRARRRGLRHACAGNRGFVEARNGRTAANDVENNSLAAMNDWLADQKRPKDRSRSETFPSAGCAGSVRMARRVAGIRHATTLYSYLLRPTTANHAFSEVVMRDLNCTLSGAPGEHADFLLRLAPILRAEVENKASQLYEKIDLPLAPVLARMESAGVRVDPKELDRISCKAQKEIGISRKTFTSWLASNSK